jgi:hypothetical protein
MRGVGHTLIELGKPLVHVAERLCGRDARTSASAARTTTIQKSKTSQVDEGTHEAGLHLRTQVDDQGLGGGASADRGRAF